MTRKSESALLIGIRKSALLIGIVGGAIVLLLCFSGSFYNLGDIMNGRNNQDVKAFVISFMIPVYIFAKGIYCAISLVLQAAAVQNSHNDLETS